MSDYYSAVVETVRAEAQAEAYKLLLGGDFLTETEQDVLRWGRNATGTSPKRMSQNALSKEIYRSATAVECLVSKIMTIRILCEGLFIHFVRYVIQKPFLSCFKHTGRLFVPNGCATSPSSHGTSGYGR